MSRTKNTGANAVQDNALHGHNHDELVKGIMERFHKEEQIISACKARQKEALREAKECGVLKQAIRKAYKDLMQTEEQKQAADEVAEARKEYAKICKEVGLLIMGEAA